MKPFDPKLKRTGLFAIPGGGNGCTLMHGTRSIFCEICIDLRTHPPSKLRKDLEEQAKPNTFSLVYIVVLRTPIHCEKFTEESEVQDGMKNKVFDPSIVDSIETNRTWGEEGSSRIRPFGVNT
jgi:hypothetical protein